MPEMSSYAHGVPSWVDIGTPDLKAGLAFYAEMFGWEGQDMGEEAGHYTIVSKGGKRVAALSPAQDPGPPRWTTYVNVTDADEVAARVAPAGGTVVLAPMDVMGAGRMAIFQDATGAFIAVWQPGDHKGAQTVNEPGTFIWSELQTSNMESSRAFYTEVFGWSWGGSDQYAEAGVGGRVIGGVMPRPEALPPEVPDYWLVYFGSSRIDGDAEKAKELGATLVVEPTDIPGAGRFAVIIDPQGAVFGIFRGADAT